MGFKITHPLLPRRRLTWPLWHTSTWRQHVPPDRMSGTTDTTKGPRCFLFHCVLRRGLFLTFSHLVPHSQGGWLYTVGHQSKVAPPLLQRGTAPRAAFHSHAGSVSWFLSAFECHYTCGRRGRPAADVFCLSFSWIDFTLFRQIDVQQTDSPTWLV